MTINHIHTGDALETLKTFPDQSVDCCVTSPPYWGLRDYGHANQLGLERTPEQYIAGMVEVFTEVYRVLKNEGTCWLNIGDSYCSTAPGSRGDALHIVGISEATAESRRQVRNLTPSGMKPKDLVGIPWMLAFALRSAGWYLRQDIIWSKPNPMPESVTDRCTKAHEYIFLLSKSQKYFYDHEAIKQPIAASSLQRLSQDVEGQVGSDRVPGKSNGTMKAIRPNGISRDRLLDYNSKEKVLRPNTTRGGYEKEGDLPLPDAKANKRSVWTVTTKGYNEAHFATFPPELIIDCIKAGCPERIFTCNCCGHDIIINDNNPSDNESIYEELQKLWKGVSSCRPVEQSENLLHEEMQFGMDGGSQASNKRMDINIERLQTNCSTQPSECREIRVCYGTQARDGEGNRQIPDGTRSCPPQEREEAGQQDCKFGIDVEIEARPSSKTKSKTDTLSSLWEEHKNIGACPKCSKGHLVARRGITIDPFSGAGTTAMVARKLNRNFLAIELNPAYVTIANKRLHNEIGMFL